MFPYDDSKTVSVCLPVRLSVPREKNHPGFVNISPTLVLLIHQWKGLHEYYSMETQKLEFFSKKFEIEF